MKQFIIVAFTLSTFITSYAQTVVQDTIYFETVNDVLYQVSRVQYDNGSYSESRIVTTKENVLREYSQAIENDAAKYANAGRIYLTSKSFVRQAIKIEKMLEDALGLSPFDLLQSNYESMFLETASSTVWQVVDNGTTKEATFSKNPNTNQLRIKVGTDSFRPVIILGQTIVVRSYPATGQDLVLFMINNRVFKDVDDNVTLRRINPERR